MIKPDPADYIECNCRHKFGDYFLTKLARVISDLINSKRSFLAMQRRYKGSAVYRGGCFYTKQYYVDLVFPRRKRDESIKVLRA